MAALDKVSEGPHSTSGPPSSLVTRVCQYPRPEKLVAWPGIELGSPAYMSVALFSLVIMVQLSIKTLLSHAQVLVLCSNFGISVESNDNYNLDQLIKIMSRCLWLQFRETEVKRGKMIRN